MNDKNTMKFENRDKYGQPIKHDLPKGEQPRRRMTKEEIKQRLSMRAAEYLAFMDD